MRMARRFRARRVLHEKEVNALLGLAAFVERLELAKRLRVQTLDPLEMALNRIPIRRDLFHELTRRRHCRG